MGDVTEFPGKPRDSKPSETSSLSLVLSFPKRGAEAPTEAEIAAHNEAIEAKLAAMREEHRALDLKLDSAERAGPLNRLEVKRLKKRKLALKDAITQLSAQVLPDIIA